MPPTVRSFSARARPPLTAPTATRRTSCSSRSFDPDPQPVAEELWPGAVVEHSVGGLAEAVEGVGDLMVSRELRRPTDALGHSNCPFGVGFPPTTREQLAGVAKAAAGPDLVKMLVLRPARRPRRHRQSLPLLSTRLHEASERRVNLGLGERRDVVVARGEDAAGAQDPRRLGESRLWLHPVERLEADDDIRAA